MLDPGIGVRREIGVLGEDVVCGHELADLDQQAAAADLGVERIKRLHRGLTIGRHEALTERRHTEVDECVLERRTAEATVRDPRDLRDGVLSQANQVELRSCPSNAAEQLKLSWGARPWRFFCLRPPTDQPQPPRLNPQQHQPEHALRDNPRGGCREPCDTRK